MKKLLSLILAIFMLSSITAFAEEYSESANMDYGYDESYDETEKQEEITTAGESKTTILSFLRR